MKKKVTRQTNEQEILNLAISEKRVRGKDLLVEIFPLLEDYFDGNITCANDCITYCLPNGQVFRLTAGEVC